MCMQLGGITSKADRNLVLDIDTGNSILATPSRYLLRPIIGSLWKCNPFGDETQQADPKCLTFKGWAHGGCLPDLRKGRLPHKSFDVCCENQTVLTFYVFNSLGVMYSCYIIISTMYFVHLCKSCVKCSITLICVYTVHIWNLISGVLVIFSRRFSRPSRSQALKLRQSNLQRRASVPPTSSRRQLRFRMFGTWSVDPVSWATWVNKSNAESPFVYR